SGNLSLQWRGEVTRGAVDSGLTVRSQLLFDIRPAERTLAWNVNASTRGVRDTVALLVPANYRVMSVRGVNVRGWTVAKNPDDGDSQRIDVTLLKATGGDGQMQPTEGKIDLDVLLSQSATTQELQQPDKLRDYPLPVVEVPEAMLHSGEIVVRNHSAFSIATRGARRLSRMDMPTWKDRVVQIGANKTNPANNNEKSKNSPVAKLTDRVSAHQAFAFASTPYELEVRVDEVVVKRSATLQSILKIAEDETTLESRFILSSRGKPLDSATLVVPRDWKLDSPSADGQFQWYELPAANNTKEPAPENSNKDATDRTQRLRFVFADPKQGTTNIVLSGTLTGDQYRLPVRDQPDQDTVDGARLPAELLLPHLRVENCDSGVGDIVVMTDPSLSVQPIQTREIRTIAKGNVTRWIQPAQVPYIRSVLRYGNIDYQGQLKIDRVYPQFKTVALTNVKLTDRAIEETILLRYRVTRSGLSKCSFVLPESMIDCRIRAPQMQRIVRTRLDGSGNMNSGDSANGNPVNTDNTRGGTNVNAVEVPRNDVDLPLESNQSAKTGASVRFDVYLQQPVIGDITILIQQDRPLSTQRYQVPLLRVLNPFGDKADFQTNRNASYVTLENAGRDEFTVVRQQGLERIRSDAPQWRTMISDIGAGTNKESAESLTNNANSAYQINAGAGVVID
ncbi:MAG: hypothetical protein AAFP90_17110, partial [Planctomycetota bacterium]